MNHFSKVRLTALEVVSERIDCCYVIENIQNLQVYLITLMTDCDMGILVNHFIKEPSCT